MDGLAQRRRSGSIGATQAQPREACVVVHYGPFHALVAEQHSLFKVAGELLARVTPWLRYVEPMESDGVMQLPDVELPRDVVQGFFVAEDNDEDGQVKACGSSSSVRLPRPTGSPAGTTAGVDSLANVNRRGRPVLTLQSAALGEIVVASWTQWESVQEMLLQEERNKYRTHYYEAGAGQPPSSFLLVHAELSVLWFEVDTLHCLHYDDLVRAYEAELGEQGDDEDDEDEQAPEDEVEEREVECDADADAEVDLPVEVEAAAAAATASATAALAALAAAAARPDANGLVDDVTGGSSAALVTQAAAAAVRASMDSPALIARLYVVDADGLHRGQVLLPVALDPPVTLAELEQLVRASANVRRHREIRLSYRVLPPSSLALAPSNPPSRPDSARVGGSAVLGGVGGGGAPSTPRDLGVSVTSTMSRYSQQPGVMARSVLKPLGAEEDISALIDDVLLYGYRAIRLVVVESEATAQAPLRPSPPPPPPQQRAAEEARRASLPPPSPYKQQQEAAVVAAQLQRLSDTSGPQSSHDGGNGCHGTSHAHRGSYDHAEEAEEEEEEEEDEEDDDDDALVVVRYTIDPVEVHVTGEVSDAQLVWLADAIYTRCCRPDNYKPISSAQNNIISQGGGVVSQRIRMRPRFLRALETVQTARSAGTPDGAEPAHWVLPLHDYQFSEADEDVMGLCIQEAMINSGEMTAIAPEEIQDLVDDLAREMGD